MKLQELKIIKLIGHWAIKLYGGDSSITREEFYNYKFDNQYEKNSVMAYAIDQFIEDFKSQDLNY